MSWFKASVTTDKAAISLHKGMGSSSIRWDDIVSISAEKVDKIIYEEVFLIIEGDTGPTLEIGELDDGFDRVQKSMPANLRGFPVGWRGNVESDDVGKRHVIWTRG